MFSFVARQPIFNEALNIFGYELLYRSKEKSTSYDGVDASAASSETIASSFHEIGIEKVTNGKRAFINFTEKLLIANVATILPSKILVIELLEDILPTPEVLSTCAQLRKKGYMIALDDFIIEPEFLPLLDVADIVKIDFLETPRPVIEDFVRNFSASNVKLLAEKIETYDDFEFAKSLGFSLFQGYFFSKPVIVSSEVKLSPHRINCLRLMHLSFDPDVDFVKISKILKQDVALSFRLLRVVNSAFFGLRYSVNNIKQALAILGMDEVKRWITLISMTEMQEDKPDELIYMSLIRARMLELLGPSVGMSNRVEDLFMLGLMSLMDAIMDTSFEELAKMTQISDELLSAIVDKTGRYGDLLSLVIHYERSEWDKAFELATKLKLKEEEIVNRYLDAISWSGTFYSMSHRSSSQPPRTSSKKATKTGKR